MSAPDTLAVGQVWQVGKGDNARDLTVVETTAGLVQVRDGYGRTSWQDPAHLSAPDARFMGWDLPIGRLMPSIPGFVGGCPGDVRPAVAPLNMPLDGQAEAFRNGSLVWWNTLLGGDTQTIADLEEVVLGDGVTTIDDWRLRTVGALSGAVYQRQGPGRWVLVRRLDGYA